MTVVLEMEMPENCEICPFGYIIEGMGNPLESWNKSDSLFDF